MEKNPPDQARAARSVDSSLNPGPQELSLDMIAGVIAGHSGAGNSTASSAASGGNAEPLGRRVE